MAYGLSMGIFWCFKYIFFMFGVSSILMFVLYWFMTLLVPFISLYQTWHYKRRIGDSIGFFHAWQFAVLLYFFAALIVSLEHYLFFRYIAPSNFLADSLKVTMSILKDANVDQKILDTVGNMSISPIRMTVQGIFNNTFFGVIFSLPVAWIVSQTKGTILPDTTDENS